ncbi:MAG: hypothetical protein Ct9H90mP7_1930 [Candidatus Neomarinimicrobiota bacterium]|nr:MAG: hypothetical protein Ct9H90mP7_1930 [Candidatus Neomarinimicrobiota bacterium]
MDEMKYDMCGSGVVLGVMRAVSILKPKMNCWYNSFNRKYERDKAYRPGDILTAYKKKLSKF